MDHHQKKKRLKITISEKHRKGANCLRSAAGMSSVALQGR